MTTSTESLIARLREAKGADRELDEAIVLALHPNAKIDFYTTGDDDKIVFHAEPLVANRGTVPLFTSSIDAALTLVPEGWAVDTCGADPTLKSQTHPRAKVSPHNGNDDGWAVYHSGPTDTRAATLAIAICIGALEARTLLALSSQPKGDAR